MEDSREKIRKLREDFETALVSAGIDATNVNYDKLAGVRTGFDELVVHLIAEKEREARRDELKGIVALHRDIGEDMPYPLGTGPYIKGRLVSLAALTDKLECPCVCHTYGKECCSLCLAQPPIEEMPQFKGTIEQLGKLGVIKKDNAEFVG